MLLHAGRSLLGIVQFERSLAANDNEFLAGTNPAVGVSYFHIFSSTIEDHDLRVTRTRGGQRTNALPSATSPTGNWSDISSNIVLTGGGDSATNYLDVGAVTNAMACFYRVRLVQ